MSTPEEDRRARFAIDRIRDILADDANYQTAALKLGGIWNWCDITGEYRRFEATIGGAIEVKIKPRWIASQDPTSCSGGK